MSNWIKKSERLPSPAEPVLVFFEIPKEPWHSYRKSWVIEIGHYNYANWEFVTHWQPLPEPPEAK